MQETYPDNDSGRVEKTFFLHMWEKHFLEAKKKALPFFILMNLFFISLLVIIFIYICIYDPSAIILYCFVLPVYVMVLAWFNRFIYWECDRYLTTILGRKGTLGYLKGKINDSSKRDFYQMGIWYFTFVPRAWCRFVRVRDLKYKDRRKI